MPFASAGSGASFLQGHGSHFPQQDVVIVHAPDTADEIRTPSRVQHQAKAGFFDVDTPVYVGDVVEMPDPRGGVRRMHVTRVDINDTRGANSFSGMSHIKAHWTEIAPRRPEPRVVYNGPVVNVTAGDHAQIAWGNRDVVQQLGASEVSPGYEELAKAVARALELLSTSSGVDPEDREVAEDAAKNALGEVVKPEPNRTVLRGALATLRGLLTTVATAVGSEGGRALIQALVLPPQ